LYIAAVDELLFDRVARLIVCIVRQLIDLFKLFYICQIKYSEYKCDYIYFTEVCLCHMLCYLMQKENNIIFY